MTLPLLLAGVVLLALLALAAWHRRLDLQRQREVVVERAEMAARTASQAPLQLPVIDLQKCLGCGTCVRECPEAGVLELVHGQAAVVNAAACVGHARCVSECPAGAVTLSQGDLGARRDVPVLDDDLQAIDQDGLFLVGEITARSLIRTAAVQGAQVAATIAARRRAAGAAASHPGVHDVVIVGAGPGGLATALGCRQHGLDFAWIDQETQVGGTVAKYPRHKLVLTDAVELPLHGTLAQREYSKEELIALWHDLQQRHRLPFRGGVAFQRVERAADGTQVVHTDQGELRASAVVLAIGRRGTPRRLGVPGEELPHVTYGLLDAAAFQDRHCVVVGGGDSAVETALALAEQPGNQVRIVYRQDAFFRLRSKNRERIQARLADGRIEALFRTEVTAIGPGQVELAQQDGGGRIALQLQADHVFVMIGGDAPFALLERSGVSFDPARRPAPAPVAAADAHSGGLLAALAIGLLLAASTLGFVLWHADYYFAAAALRAAEPKHALLRPDRALGLWFGLFATAAVFANLLYLVRRQQWFGLRHGSLASWMNAHVATGVAAVLLVMLHAAMAPKQTVGGFAFWALVVLLVTGAIGRWFYAWLPRKANGREIELVALRRELAGGDGGEPFAVAARAEVLALLERRQWHSTWLGRVIALVGLQWDLWRTQRRLRRAGAEAGVDAATVAAAVLQAEQAHAGAVAVAHLEDLRAVLGTWRWLHRWLALLMVLLLVVHVVYAVLHGAFAGGGGL
ncbi:MAG: NAD(P)-binding domain-containing protein [Planctomycetes bacterium]|jgi:thioredoxin reductase/ferredoxin|nr:NAD(P)-binding domain-containing protein [Planctomycetota bacterium]